MFKKDININNNTNTACNTPSDILSVSKIKQYIAKENESPALIDLCKLNIQLFDEIPSTNTYARELIIDGAKEGLVLSNCQTSGRGRSGHSFFSPKGTGIYMSYFFTPENGLEGAQSCTTKAAVAVASALEKLYAQKFSIKWVNDIYLEDRKICGILSEAVTTGINRGSVVIGIGINVSTIDYPDEIKDRAGCLPTDTCVTRNMIIAQILTNLVSLLALENSDKAYVREYRKRMLMLGSRVTFLEGNTRLEATIKDIDEDCGLIVAFDDGTTRTIRNGEVSELRTSP